MPSLAALHPPVVHFVVALLFVGVALRLLALTGRVSFAGPAATTLILSGTVAAVLAVKSGGDAHGPVERVPGARAAVVEHEEWGERTRNIFLVVSGVELLGLMFRRRPLKRQLGVVSAVAGLAGVIVLYEAAAHGAHLVYGYAGGVGIRSGDPADVERLLLAGLYHQAQLDRQAGRAEAAATLLDEALRRFPTDIEVQLLAAESRLVDRHHPEAAVDALEQIRPGPSDLRNRLRQGLLLADALEAAGRRDEARAVIATLAEAFPDDPRVKEKHARLADPRL